MLLSNDNIIGENKMNSQIELHMEPRRTMSWEEFAAVAQRASVALDGIVRGGPRYDEKKLIANFDHHDGVVREATMSTCMQVYYAIKGGMMRRFAEDSEKVHVWMNDTDQDSALAFMLLDHYKMFEGAASNPAVSRLLEITNRLDITAGGFPMNLNAKVVKQRNWLFAPYTELRKSGNLASASAEVLRDNLEAMNARFEQFLMGGAEEIGADTRHEILHKSSQGYWLVNEIGGTDAREFLFSKGMDAYISVVAKRPDGARVITVGRRSRYIPFPVNELFEVYNEAEGLSRENGWNGSDIVGGSPRRTGTRLTDNQIVELTDRYLSSGGKSQ